MSIFPQGTFIFDASKGETPQTIARKREIVDRIMYGRRRSPQNIGEGIAALGDGIVAGVLNRRANKAEEAGQQGANALKENIIAAMMGGDNLPFPPAPGGDQPQNYASQGAAQVHIPTGERAGYIRQGLLQRGLPEHVADAFLNRAGIAGGILV